MEIFQFNGDWETTLHLPIFAERLDNNDLIPHFEKENRAQARFHLQISDSPDDSPEPTAAQLAAIRFVQENQEGLLAAIFEYHKNVIYPSIEEKWGISKTEYPDYFPEFESVADLKKLMHLIGVNIDLLEKAGMAYFSLDFKWLIDQEHGLSIHFYQLKPIEFGSSGEIDYRKAIEDAGLDFKKINEEHDKNYHEKEAAKHTKIRESGIYEPQGKHGKLKPWQEDANRFYPFHLVHNDDFEPFEAFFADEKNSKYWRVDELLSVAVSWKRQRFIDFLTTLAPQDVYASICNAIENGDLPTMKRLLVFEKDINRQRGQEAYLNKLMGKLYKNYADTPQRAIFEAAIEHFIERGANPFLQERWGRDSFFVFKYFEDETVKLAIKKFVENLCKKYDRKPETAEPANPDAAGLLQKLKALLGV